MSISTRLDRLETLEAKKRERRRAEFWLVWRGICREIIERWPPTQADKAEWRVRVATAWAQVEGKQ